MILCLSFDAIFIDLLISSILALYIDKHNKMIRQRTHEESKKIMVPESQPEQDPQLFFCSHHHQHSHKYTLSIPLGQANNIEPSNSKKKQATKGQGDFVQKNTPKDNKTQKNYSINQTHKERSNHDRSDIQHNRFQTIKKEKEKVQRNKAAINSSRKQRQPKSFQLVQTSQQTTQTLQGHPTPHNQRQSSGNGTIQLQKGWIYRGQYSNQLFHGHGELYCQQQLIYSGHFQFGYFHGYGKLQNCRDFLFLISGKKLYAAVAAKLSSYDESGCMLDASREYEQQSGWKLYSGQFNRGRVQGFGQIVFSAGVRVAARWHGGRPDMHKWMVVHQK